MRPDIFRLLQRLFDALEATPGERVTLPAADVERLAKWVRAGEMREINAYGKALGDAAALIAANIPDRGQREGGMFECCRGECMRMMRFVHNKKTVWMRDRAGGYREARLREDHERWQRTKPAPRR